MAVFNVLTVLVATVGTLLLATNTNAQGPLSPNQAVGVDDAVASNPFDSILEWLRNSPQHTVLIRLLAVVKMDTELGVNSNRLTMMAPTNSAFANFGRRLDSRATILDSDPESVINAVLAGLRIIEGPGLRSGKSILSYHIMQSANSFQRLEKLGEVETLAGPTLTFAHKYKVFDKDNSREISTAQVNVLNTNGWVHAVNDVLVPFNLEKVLESLKTPTPSPSPAPSGPAVTPFVPVAIDDPTDVSPSPEESVEPSPSDEADEDDDGGVCFPATARVHVAGGNTIAMADLKAGHSVMHDENGSHSPVFLFTHRSAQKSSRFLRLATACGHAVTMTHSHYVHVSGKLVAADTVRVGDELRTISGLCAVSSISNVHGTGLYAPHSMHGDLVVDGIVVSGYSRAVAPRVAHALLLPVRWAARITGVVEPLGRAFYDGGDWALRFLPRGRDEY